MGIERFFNSLVKNNTVKKDGGILVLEKKIVADYFYIDFNSILYNISMKIEEQLNKLLYDIIDDNKNITSESIKVAHKYGFDLSNPTLNNFIEYFNEEYVDRIILYLIVEQLELIIEELIDGDNIKSIYIAMDGIPNMAKMLEQKKRRYIGYIMSKVKKGLYLQHEPELSEKRKIYEKYKYVFNRSKILAWHEFMNNVSELLTSTEFVDKIKKRFQKLTRYVFSGANVPGEGEKKIMEDVIENQGKGKYVVYSPDADVLILSMIMLNQTDHNNEFYVMRFDQNSCEYSIVDINKLCTNTFEYIKSNINNITLTNNTNLKNILDKKTVINDIAFVFTMFGNDFVSKIESIDVRNDFEVVLHIYAELMNNSQKSPYYITYYNGKKYNINFVSLSIFLYKLKQDEELLLNDTYMASRYKNYRFIKEALNTRNAYSGLQEYTKRANYVFSIINDWLDDINKDKQNLKQFIDANYNKLLDSLIMYDNKNKNNNDKFIDINKSPKTREFIKSFLILEKSHNDKYDHKKITNDQIYFLFKNKITNYFKKDKTNKYMIEGTHRLRFKHYETSINTKFYEERMMENIPSDKIVVTDYDRAIYSFEYMLDEFRKKLNAVDDGIGYTNIRVIKNKYIYVGSPYEKNNTKYYDTYFSKKSKADICKSYIEGICWVFDFYFNKNKSEHNFNNISTWFYKYHKAPLLGDLSDYLNNITNKDELLKMYTDVVNKTVSREEFMNINEHYVYITPKNSVNLLKLPKSIQDIITSDRNKDNFPDLDIFAQQILNEPTTDDNEEYNNKLPLDCRRASYLTKCALTTVKEVEYNEYIKMVKPTRLTYTNTLSIKEPTIIVFDRNHKQKGGMMNGINDIDKIMESTDEKILHEIKHLYKEKYIDTNYKLYKCIYKIAKHRLNNKN